MGLRDHTPAQYPPPMNTPPGRIGWIDLTVPDAETNRDFYAAVAGWTPEPVDMGGYADFNMTADGTPVAGVCHARSMNAEIHDKIGPAWLIYITVADLDAALAACEARGGTLLVGPKSMGQARYAIIRDPAGAPAALFQPA